MRPDELKYNGEVFVTFTIARDMLSMSSADIQWAMANGRLAATRTPDGWRISKREVARAQRDLSRTPPKTRTTMKAIDSPMVAEFSRATAKRQEPEKLQATVSRTGEVLVSLPMACEVLGLSPVDIQHVIASGQLRAVRDIEHGWKIPIVELRAALVSNRFVGFSRT